MTLLKKAQGLVRYYRERIIEDYTDKRWQVSYSIATKLLDMVENERNEMRDVQNLLTYCEQIRDEIFHSAYMNLVTVIDDLRLELTQKSS